MSDHDVTRSVGAMRRNADGWIERWDGRKWVTAARIRDMHIEPPVVETVLAGVDAIEHREQLARDVARLWTAYRAEVPFGGHVGDELLAALDRLVVAHQPETIDRRTGGGPTG